MSKETSKSPTTNILLSHLVNEQTILIAPYTHVQKINLLLTCPYSFKWNSPNDEKDTLPLDMVKAGDHCERNISRHMLPLLFIFG